MEAEAHAPSWTDLPPDVAPRPVTVDARVRSALERRNEDRAFRYRLASSLRERYGPELSCSLGREAVAMADGGSFEAEFSVDPDDDGSVLAAFRFTPAPEPSLSSTTKQRARSVVCDAHTGRLGPVDWADD